MTTCSTRRFGAHAHSPQHPLQQGRQRIATAHPHSTPRHRQCSPKGEKRRHDSRPGPPARFLWPLSPPHCTPFCGNLLIKRVPCVPPAAARCFFGPASACHSARHFLYGRFSAAPRRMPSYGWPVCCAPLCGPLSACPLLFCASSACRPLMSRPRPPPSHHSPPPPAPPRPPVFTAPPACAGWASAYIKVSIRVDPGCVVACWLVCLASMPDCFGYTKSFSLLA